MRQEPGVTSILRLVLEVYTYVLIASVFISWVAPGSQHPAIQLVNRLTEPLLSQVRRVVPPMGGLDLSARLVLLAIAAVQRYGL